MNALRLRTNLLCLGGGAPLLLATPGDPGIPPPCPPNPAAKPALPPPVTVVMLMCERCLPNGLISLMAFRVSAEGRPRVFGECASPVGGLVGFCC